MKKISYIFLFPALILFGCGKQQVYKSAEVSRTHEIKARDHFTQGMFYELENKHENALIEFYQALLYDSTSSTVYNRIAENHMSLGRYESALRYLQKSLKLQPDEPETIRLIADCHYRLKDDEKAIDNLRRVLEIDPLDENARSLLLLLYRKNGNYLGLAKQYEQMITIYGEDEDWVRKAATIYLKNGQVDEALALFKLYVEADSGNAGMWYSVGMAYELKELPEDAITAYGKAIEIAPEVTEAAERVYSLCRKEQKWERLISIFQPFVEINDDGTRWTPHNYDNTVSGYMSLREGLRRSKNLVSIRLIREITPRLVAGYAKRMGISTRIRPVSSLALGTSEVKPIELVSAYGVFSNKGVHVKPISITKIEDKTGNIIYRNQTIGREVLSPETTQIMNNMLQDVVNHGTGYSVRRDFEFYEIAGGKTGTTNDYTDAWFVGFTPHLASGVWVGFDDPSLSLGSGEAGARAALPFWAIFMKTVYDSLDFPPKKFAESPNVVKIQICKSSKKLITNYCPEPIEELFNLKFIPTEVCDEHEGPQSVRRERRKRF